MKPIEISQPEEGADTLVAQLAVLRVLEVLERVKKLDGGDPSPKSIESYLDEAFEDMSPVMRKKIELLARGLTPPDDLELDDCDHVTRHKDTTFELTLVEPRPELEAGDMLFFQNKRWLITQADGLKLTIKHL